MNTTGDGGAEPSSASGVTELVPTAVLQRSHKLDSSGNLKRKQDPQSKRILYHNESTGQSQWDQPEGYTPSEVADFVQLRSGSSPTAVYGNWTEMTTEDGRIFFYNKVSGESQWQRPDSFPAAQTGSSSSDSFSGVRDTSEGESKPSERIRRQSVVTATHKDARGHTWSRRHDSTSKRDFYFNEVTGESQWGRPEGFPLEPGHEDHKDHKMVHRSNSATGKRSTKHDRRMSHVIVKKGVWDRMEDPATKRIFYHNSVTGETSWNRPDGFRDGVDQDEAKKASDEGVEGSKRKSSLRKEVHLHKWILSRSSQWENLLFQR